MFPWNSTEKKLFQVQQNCWENKFTERQTPNTIHSNRLNYIIFLSSNVYCLLYKHCLLYYFAPPPRNNKLFGPINRDSASSIVVITIKRTNHKLFLFALGKSLIVRWILNHLIFSEWNKSNSPVCFPFPPFY